MNSLEDQFVNLVLRFTDDKKVINECWEEIKRAYTDSRRHYHNLQHIEFMIQEADQIKDRITSYQTFLAAIFYHDLVFDVNRQDNEERSADKAVERLTQLGFSKQDIEKCRRMILATKEHQTSSDPDTNYLIDIDLAIMGQNEEVYKNYVLNIRKEYSIYPDDVFETVRKQIIRDFLMRRRIYTSDFYYDKYEAKARKNLKIEI